MSFKTTAAPCALLLAALAFRQKGPAEAPAIRLSEPVR